MKRFLTAAAAVFAVVLLVLLIGCTTQRIDSFRPYESPPLHLPKAMVTIHPPHPDDHAACNWRLNWFRVKELSPSLTVFAFDPAYEELSVRAVEITVNGTNQITVSQPAKGQHCTFESYPIKDAFRNDYPGADPRWVNCWPAAEDPRLHQPPPPGTRVTFRVDLDFLARGEAVCRTNYQADFILEREQTCASWAAYLVSLFVPKF